jgi:tripartite-type tricarboxylate transporter receptor subunit TctC
MLKRRSSVTRTLCAGMVGACCGSALAQQGNLSHTNYPNRPIRFITPYAPGGSTSVISRLVAQHLTERWGQNVIVDNRPGGNTVIGTELAAKSPPDGYTMLLTPVTHSILSNLMKTPYDPIRDFAPVATVAISPQLLVVHPSVSANTVQELIALARTKPGQLNFASAGTGGSSHLAGEVFNMLAGVKTQHVPYKGGGPATIDLLGGHVQMFYSVPLNVVSHVQAGKLKAIAVTGNARVPALPQTPTFADAGLPGFDVKTWNGITLPAGTPRPIINKMSAEINAMLATPSVKEKLEAIGTSTLISTPEEFAAMMHSEIALYSKTAKAANLRID